MKLILDDVNIYKHGYIYELVIYINMNLRWQILDYWIYNDFIYAYVQLYRINEIIEPNLSTYGFIWIHKEIKRDDVWNYV